MRTLQVHDPTEEQWWEAELYRLEGALRLQLPTPDVLQAEACFQQALDVARSQQAKSLELRAALSLSRLWQQQGKRTAARHLLAPIYGWLTEGFDTADLQEVKALLDEWLWYGAIFVRLLNKQVQQRVHQHPERHW
jgi:predicted ATPase